MHFASSKTLIKSSKVSPKNLINSTKDTDRTILNKLFKRCWMKLISFLHNCLSYGIVILIFLEFLLDLLFLALKQSTMRKRDNFGQS